MNEQDMKRILGIPNEKAFFEIRKRRDSKSFYKIRGKYCKALQQLDVAIHRRNGDVYEWDRNF